jgi:hypothetical protein
MNNVIIMRAFVLGSFCALGVVISSVGYSKTEKVPYSFENKPVDGWNFGVVKMNSTYQIYRSEMLGSEGLKAVSEGLRENKLPFPKTIIYMNTNGYSNKDLRAMEEFREKDFYNYSFFHSFLYNYRTYLDGKNPYEPNEDIDAKNYLGDEAKDEFGVVSDKTLDGGVDAFARILDVVLDPSKQPVLIHCLGGRHRTGMTALALRYIEGGEWLKGSHSVRLPPYTKSVTLNNAQYEYYKHNTLMFRFDNLKFIDTFFAKDPLADRYISRFRRVLTSTK